jgi:hypothetical protein
MYVVRFGGPSPHALHFRRPHLLGRGAIPQDGGTGGGGAFDLLVVAADDVLWRQGLTDRGRCAECEPLFSDGTWNPVRIRQPISPDPTGPNGILKDITVRVMFLSISTFVYSSPPGSLTSNREGAPAVPPGSREPRSAGASPPRGGWGRELSPAAAAAEATVGLLPGGFARVSFAYSEQPSEEQNVMERY